MWVLKLIVEPSTLIIGNTYIVITDIKPILGENGKWSMPFEGHYQVYHEKDVILNTVMKDNDLIWKRFIKLRRHGE